MALPDELCARWKEIERALGARGPVPDDVRRYLWDVAHLLNKAVEGDDLLVGQRQRLTPKQAAALVPEVLGLSASAIRAQREARRADGYGWMFELMKQQGIVKRGQVEKLAHDMSEAAKVTTRQIHRWGARWRASRREEN